MGGRALPKQAVKVELFYSGAWQDITAAGDVFTDPIVIKRGRSDEGQALRPCSVACSLANDDDRYRTSNPLSPLYGKAGRNTPMRVSVASTVRATAEASSWAADQTTDFRASPPRGKAWVDMDAGGLLQRIGQWTEPLRSPFRQYNDTLPLLLGYWPAEQDRGTTELISTTLGTAPGRFNQDIAFDSQYRPPSSAPLMDIGQGDNAEVGAYFRRDTSATSTDGYQISWVARYNQLVAGEQDIFDWATTNGGQYGLYLNPTTGQMLVYAIDATGASLIAGAGLSYNGYDWSQWTLFTIDAQYSAGTTALWVNWRNATDTASGFWTSSFVGVPSQPDWWDTSVFAGVPRGSTLGHVLGVSEASTGGTVDLFGSARRNAWTGYLGETAADRFSRLCTLKGIAYTIVGNSDLSTPMGPQQVGTLAEQFAEIVSTEDGLLFDREDAIGLVFMLRNARYAQVPALTLTPTDLPVLPVEVADDLGVHNVVTVSQRDGGDVTAVDDTGPLGTQPPPDGVGEARQTVDVNLATPDTGLPGVANWWLRRGTINLPRFPQVTVDLNAKPGLIPAVETVDVGSVITIVGFREDPIRLYVLGWTETIGTHTRTITFTCAPDQPYDIAIQGNGSRRQDSYTSTLNASYNTTATTMVVTFTVLSDQWSQDNEPFDWIVAGERITVTSMGAVTGSGPWTQTATVTRSVNGVVKSHSAAEPVHMHPEQQARQAL